MAMRAVPIKSALSTAAEQPATAATPSMTNMGPPKVAAQEVAETSDPGEVALQGGSQGLDRAEAPETDSAQADNSKKRKAEGEARQSPEVDTAVAGSIGKRRASPEAEVGAKAVTVQHSTVHIKPCCVQSSADMEACCCLLQCFVH